VATYTFETITPEQALAFTASDSLTFSTPGASASMVQVVFVPLPGLPEDLPSLQPRIALTFNGVTREFNASALAGFGGLTGQIIFPNSSMLFPGTTGADCILGTAWDDGLYGGEGADTFAGGEGSDVLQGNSGADSLTGGVGNDTIYGGRDNDRIEPGPTGPTAISAPIR
jgi:hypothetical protein